MSKHKKEDILTKGSELFRTKGYNNTGIEVILKECGIPKGSFYNFFKNKEEFGELAIDQYGEENNKWMKELLSNKNISPLERLKQLYNSIIEFHVSENFKNGCLIGNLAQEMGGISEKLANAVSRNFQRTIDIVTGVINEGQKSGEIRNDYSAEELANYMQNSFYGAILRGKSEKNDSSFKLFTTMSFDFITKK